MIWSDRFIGCYIDILNLTIFFKLFGMRRADLPPVPQLSLVRKKSQQVPTTDKG